MFGDYEALKKEIYNEMKIDLNAYKEQQMKRRIEAFIVNHNYTTYREFLTGLKEDKILKEAFETYLTIHVSDFFRNIEQWEILSSTIFPFLISKFGKELKIWSAACSSGEEAYSLAILLTNLLPSAKINIFATDIDKQILQKAKMGIYKERELSGLTAQQREKYFKEVGTDQFQILDHIKKCVRFETQDLLDCTYPGPFHLIVCRNVLIYFTEAAKMKIYKKISEALYPDGMLFIGSTEQLIHPQECGLQAFHSFFYKKS